MPNGLPIALSLLILNLLPDPWFCYREFRCQVAGAMAQSVKRLPHKHEDRRSIPSDLTKGKAWYGNMLLQIPGLGDGGWCTSGAHWQVSLTYLVRSRRVCRKPYRLKVWKGGAFGEFSGLHIWDIRIRISWWHWWLYKKRRSQAAYVMPSAAWGLHHFLHFAASISMS